MKNVEKIKPTGLFTNYIYKAIPLAFDESMSYYETLCGLLSYLKDTVIPTLNNNADAIVEVQNLMQQLQEYVNNYFTNLDVQEEINNKLDKMVESGELSTIIKALTPPSVYTDLSNKIFLFVGDSYADGGAGSSWAENIKTMLNLNSNSVNLSHGGAGFGTPPSNNFKLQLENYVSEHTISEREAVDYILVAGGANDFDNLKNGSITAETIKTRIEQFSIYAKNNFPNAKIYIAQIGRSFNGERWDYIRTVINLYRDTTLLGMNYINNSEYILHKSSLLYDNLHPTSEGNNLIAKGLIDGILKGGCEVHYYLSNHLRKVDGNNLDFQGNAYYQVQSSTDNGISTLTLKGFSGQYNILKISGSETLFNGQEQKAMFEFEDSCFFGNFNNLYHGRTISQRVAIIAGGERLWANLNMNIIDNKIYFQFLDLPYPVNITEMYIYPFTISAPSVDC